MIADWVAGSVRARALARRRLGAVTVRQLAAAPSLTAALASLASTPYGHDVRAGQSLTEAQRAVSATLLWNLRVLAGWLPLEGVTALRALTAWFELLNVEAHLRELAGTPAPTPYRLGSLATAWPRLAATTSPAEVRAVLTSSPWGDPGTDSPQRVELAMRTRFAGRVAATLPEAAGWSSAAATLLLARERFLVGSPLTEPSMSNLRALIGSEAVSAAALPELLAALPPRAWPVLAGVDEPGQLWRSELSWWQVVEADAFRLLREPRFGRQVVCGAVALMAVDAWRVTAALELAARGGHPLEAFDDVA